MRFLKHKKVFIFFLNILSLIFFYFNSGGYILLSPDSANYITTALNLIDGKGFYYFSNWPSISMLAELEPYTEYPPLFPILLAINFIFFGFNEFSLKFFQYMQIFLLSLAIGNLCFRLKMSLLMIFLIIIVFYIN